MGSFLLWSCHAPVIQARWWIMAITFFPALFGRPLAAIIDLRVELMTKMTNPWGAQVREIMREMERDREGEQETETSLRRDEITHKHILYCASTVLSVAERGVFWLKCAVRRHATFMQHRAVISFWVQELLGRCWHDAPGSDRCCHPDSATRPPSRQEMSAETAEDPGPCWEHDPNLALTTAPITGADLIVSLLGEKEVCENRSERHGCSTTLTLKSFKPRTQLLFIYSF